MHSRKIRRLKKQLLKATALILAIEIYVLLLITFKKELGLEQVAKLKLLQETKEVEIVEKKINYKYYVLPLLNKDYYFKIKRLIAKAKKSIYIAMLVIDPDSNPVDELLKALVDAKKRGVQVKVILENPGTDSERDEHDKLYSGNKKVIKYLCENKIDAKFDSVSKTTHDKLIIIDGHIVVVGNHNWTYPALMFNNEVSALIKSSPANPEFTNYFNAIEEQIYEQ